MPLTSNWRGLNTKGAFLNLTQVKVHVGEGGFPSSGRADTMLTLREWQPSIMTSLCPKALQDKQCVLQSTQHFEVRINCGHKIKMVAGVHRAEVGGRFTTTPWRHLMRVIRPPPHHPPAKETGVKHALPRTQPIAALSH